MHAITHCKIPHCLIAVSIALLCACTATPDNTERTVTIKRNTWGVPHIYADTVRGLFYGYGYAVAEDRLFQMEMTRRSVLGTVAEVLGEEYAELDAQTRQLFDPASIKAQLAALAQEDRDIFDGYADGFNARIKDVLSNRGELLPKQFIDADFDPMPWSGYDVAMIWIGTMANRFSGGSSEISNLQLLQQLVAAKGDKIGVQLFDQIRWLEDPTAPTTVPRENGSGQPVPTSEDVGHAQRETLLAVKIPPIAQHDALRASWHGWAAPQERATASNLWILGPDKTSDGSTILNNGPQFGWFNPSYLYGVGLHGAGFNVVGNTPYGYPQVLFASNGQISWGSTAGPQDVNDIYRETLNPDNPMQYFHQGEYREMQRRVETVNIKGAFDLEVEIFSTVHGVVKQIDLDQNTAWTMRRSWDGLEVQSMLGWIHSMKAQNWDEFLAQAAKMATTINWYYADAKGNIGYVSPGRLPIRPVHQDIRLPALGDGSMEWEGFKSFDEIPKVYNPAQGYISNWNNQPAPGVLADGGNYGFVDRVRELNIRIESKPKLTPDEIWNLLPQTSLVDTNARYFIPSIVDATQGLAASDPARQAAQLLAAWDGRATNPDAGAYYLEPAAAIMRAWLPIMYRKLLTDDLPPEVFAQYTSAGYDPVPAHNNSIRPGEASKLLYNALLGEKAGVSQRIDFFNGQDKQAMIREALYEAVNELTAQYGRDMSKWVVKVIPMPFSPVNFMGYPQAGSDEQLTLPTHFNRGTENNQVIFSADRKVSICTVAPPGQSGFIAPSGEKSPHYQDQMELYQTFGCKQDAWSDDEVNAQLESVRELRY